MNDFDERGKVFEDFTFYSLVFLLIKLFFLKEKFGYRGRPIADYGDDSVITEGIANSLIREAGQIVSLIQRMIEEGDI